MLPDTLHALADQLSITGGDTAHHVLHIGIIEHRAMHNTSARQMIERIATNLPVTDHDVFATAGLGINA